MAGSYISHYSGEETNALHRLGNRLYLQGVI